MRDNKLFINKKKCSFEKQRLEYLGHIISGSWVAADPKKIEAMMNWPVPKNLKGLGGFLVLTRYCRRFVKGCGNIAWALT